MKKYLLLILALVFIAGCIGSRPVNIEANNGLKIEEFSADPKVAEYSDNVLFTVSVENVGGTTAKFVSIKLFGLENIWRRQGDPLNLLGATDVERGYGENFDPPLPAQNRPGDLKIFTKTFSPPILPEGVEQDFPITARVTFQYSTTASIVVPTISKTLLKIKTDKGETIESTPRISNSDGPLKIGLAKGTAPIVVDEKKGTEQEATFVFEFVNIGDGFPVGALPGLKTETGTPAETLGLLEGSITVLGPGVRFDTTDGCLGFKPAKEDNKIEFRIKTPQDAAKIDLQKLRSTGRLPFSCTVRILQSAFTPTTSGIITFSIQLEYNYFVDKTINVRVIGTGEEVKVTPPPAKSTSTSTTTTTPATPSPFKNAFVTSRAYNGDFNGLEGADALCQRLAGDAGMGLPRRWVALLSDSDHDAQDRVSDMEYRRLDGAVIANSKADLFDKSIKNPINIDETKQTPGPPRDVWTGTSQDGRRSSSHCTNWKSAIAGAVGGVFTETDGNWLSKWSAGGICGTLLRLYCFEI